MKFSAFGLGSGAFYAVLKKPQQQLFRVLAMRKGMVAAAEFEVRALDEQEACNAVLAEGYTLALVA